MYLSLLKEIKDYQPTLLENVFDKIIEKKYNRKKLVLICKYGDIINIELLETCKIEREDICKSRESSKRSDFCRKTDYSTEEIFIKDYKNLTEIDIPEGVNSIGTCTFYFCTKLKEIVIPKSVSIIEKYAFYYCTNLTKIVIPKSLTVISHGTFFGCKNLKKIVIPQSQITIGKNVFNRCTNLLEIIVPKNTDLSNTGLDKKVKIVYI